MRTLALLVCLLLPGWLSATQVYKSIAPDGSVEYSDQPGPDASPLQIPPSPTLAPLPKAQNPSPPSPPSPASQASEPSVQYQAVEIVSPQQDAAIRQNAGRLTLQVKVEPGLDVQAGDRLAVRMDGSLLAGRFTGDQLTLSNVDRGTHQVVVEVVDSKGNTRISSQPLSIHMLRHSILNP